MLPPLLIVEEGFLQEETVDYLPKTFDKTAVRAIINHPKGYYNESYYTL